MINKAIEKLINEQINEEMFSAYLYMSMSSWFESQNLPGFANWMRVQTLEEMTHADKFYHHLIDRGGRALLKPIKGPDTEWASPLAVFEASYKHEQHITSLINNLVDKALSEKDHAANAMLQWFVTEQVEEEKNAEQVIQKLKMMGQAPGGMFMLDQELGLRVFTPPVVAAT